MYLTREFPGVGGQIKQRPEDFLVEEIPLYPPSGQGEHLYIFVEKQGLTTLQLRDAIAHHFQVDRRAIGHAGLKDKHAITRQVISVHIPGKAPEEFPSFQHDRARVLWIDLHENKLQRGHLMGNRFSIKIRGVDPLKVRDAKRSLEMLARIGMPNRFGEQRFGYLMNNHLVGRALIKGDHQAALDLILSPKPGAPKGSIDAREAYAQGDYAQAADLMPKVFKVERNALRSLARGDAPDRAIKAIDPTAAGFFISSFQSAIFNAVLNDRVQSGTLDTLEAGDLAFVLKSRASFEVTTQELESGDETLQNRLDAFEISPSGPMWGTTMPRAEGEVGQRELAALAQADVSPKDMELCEQRDGLPMIGGDRRPLRIPVIDPEVEGGIDEHGSYIRCAFELPRGSFATTVMDEVMKTSTQQGVENGDGP
ncbi:MAG: tRNA pseudouridine(13) synthase TruD [Phycisphaerales bacterium JB052]